MDWGPDTWRHYKAWSVIKVLGRWPLQVFGVGDLPRTLIACPCCRVPAVSVVHMLMECPATWDLSKTWAVSSGRSSNSQRLSWSLLRLELFADRISFATDMDSEGASRIRFVGKASELIANAFLEQQASVEIDQLFDGAKQPQ